MFFHKEEKLTTAILEDYENNHPGSLVIFTFSDGDVYKCKFDTSFESENSADSNKPEDEYWALSYHIETIIIDGPNHLEPYDFIEIAYNHFPVKVTTENGEIIYCTE